MTLERVNLSERTNRVLNIVKAKYGLKNKSEALTLIVNEYKERFLEPEAKPEYIKKLNRIRKGKFIRFNSIDDLRKKIES